MVYHPNEFETAVTRGQNKSLYCKVPEYLFESLALARLDPLPPPLFKMAGFTPARAVLLKKNYSSLVLFGSSPIGICKGGPTWVLPRNTTTQKYQNLVTLIIYVVILFVCDVQYQKQVFYEVSQVHVIYV